MALLSVSLMLGSYIPMKGRCVSLKTFWLCLRVREDIFHISMATTTLTTVATAITTVAETIGSHISNKIFLQSLFFSLAKIIDVLALSQRLLLSSLVRPNCETNLPHRRAGNVRPNITAFKAIGSGSRGGTHPSFPSLSREGASRSDGCEVLPSPEYP